jgi:hypothetical protein
MPSWTKLIWRGKSSSERMGFSFSAMPNELMGFYFIHRKPLTLSEANKDVGEVEGEPSDLK